ncbi:hypothetical protein CAOG_009405 [Capsaspora owczarzaki ATCC 30864]|uniref:PHD-type domain-containing protein n=1 Tax=Capsaspora owczarzaki (strain ATCC 30864) TaxID=595528 RepID=A0A0D2WIW4_CAPO3|nr:hypothetical protein CAOG_009405 [Capsaspora owczarzaki ATCC 30864]
MDVQADGDESASVPADGDSSRGRRQRPAASPRRNSAQAPPPPAEVMMAADGARDQNDEFCTECRGTGRLLCCDGCPRAFHPVCLDIDENELADDDSAWYCHACSVSRLQQGAAWTTASFAGSPNSAVSASSSSMPPPPQESSSSSSAPAPASVSAVSAPAPESRPTETTGLQDTQPTQSQAAPALPQPDDGDGSSSSSATEEQSANPATLTASTVVQRYFAPSEPQAQQSGSPRSNTVMLAPPPSSRAAPTPTATARRNVRGPRSALTSFLEEQGIRSRVPTDWYRRRNGNEAAAAAAAAATAAAQATATAAMATDAAAADAQVESAASSSSAPSFNAQTATAPDGSLLLAPMLGRSATSALQSMDTANGNGAANGEPSGKDKDKGKGKGKEQAASSTGTPKRKSRKRNGSSSSSSSSDDDDNDWQFRGDSNFVADMARDGHTICIICHCRLTPENMSISRPSWCMQCLQNAREHLHRRRPSLQKSSQSRL